MAAGGRTVANLETAMRNRGNPTLKQASVRGILNHMNPIRYIYWQDGDMWLGHLEEFPDYMTQGSDLEELQNNLRDIYDDLTGGNCGAQPARLCRQVAKAANRRNVETETKTNEYNSVHVHRGVGLSLVGSNCSIVCPPAGPC